MLPQLLVLVFGLSILLISTQIFVHQAEKLSQALRFSPLIIGSTLVAIGTSLPEMSVSVIAAARGDMGLALSNIIGSNIVNILLIFPAGLLAGKIRVGTTKTINNLILLLFTTSLYCLLTVSPSYTASAGVLLLLTALLVTAIEIFWALKGQSQEDRKYFSGKRHPKISLLWLMLPLTGVFFGSLITVNQVELLAVSTGLSTTILGFTLTAIATSLPELLTTFTSQSEHQEKLTTGNIIGSNIYNLTLTGGLIYLVNSHPIYLNTQLYFLLGITLAFCLLLLICRGKNLPRRLAWWFLAGAGGYLLLL